MEEVTDMWSIPDWVPAAAFAAFWGTLFVCGVWDLFRNN